MPHTVRYGRRRDKGTIDRGSSTTTLRPARRAHGLPAHPARPGHARAGRPGGQRAPAHARPAPRGGRPARRRGAVLVHVARAGARHPPLAPGAGRDRPRAPRSTPPSAPTCSTWPGSSCRCPRATTRARPRRSCGRSSPASSPTPPSSTGPRADLLAWNRPAVAVFTDFGAMPPEGRNLLRWLFADPARDHTAATWEDTAKHTLARFRAQHARRPDDPSFAALIEELSAASPEFRAWWPRHEVVAEQAGTKTIEGHALGTLRLHHLQSTPTSDPELRLTMYVPADAETRRILEACQRSTRPARSGCRCRAPRRSTWSPCRPPCPSARARAGGW